MSGSDKVRAVVEAATTHAVEQYDPAPRRRWRTAALVAGIVLVVSLLAGGSWVIIRLNHLRDVADHNARVAVTLGDQVRDLGATPRVQPPRGDGATDADRQEPDIHPAGWICVDGLALEARPPR